MENGEKYDNESCPKMLHNIEMPIDGSHERGPFSQLIIFKSLYLNPSNIIS